MSTDYITLDGAGETCLANSRRWFPQVHERDRDALIHCVLGLAGEAGEVANKVKKWSGYTAAQVLSGDISREDIAEECVDALVYALNIITLLGFSPSEELARKMAICEARWGTP